MMVTNKKLTKDEYKLKCKFFSLFSIQFKYFIISIYKHTIYYEWINVKIKLNENYILN